MSKYPSENMQHLIFTTKWRKPFFGNLRVRYQCEALIRHICAFHDIEVLAIGFDATKPNHVHLMVVLPNKYKMSVPYACQQMKWFSSIHLRKTFGWLRQDKYFWGVHYFQKSVGGGRAKQEAYIRRQGLE
jgi:REP element-mobilizing transposase RayT